MFGKKSRIEDQIVFRRRLTIYVYVNKQASLLAVTSHAAEVSGLKQRLEQTEEELGRAKKQLEDNQGIQSFYACPESMNAFALTAVP